MNLGTPYLKDITFISMLGYFSGNNQEVAGVIVHVAFVGGQYIKTAVIYYCSCS